MSHIGTAHFKTMFDAIDYYSQYGYSSADVREKIASGEIAIGEPKQVDGTAYKGIFVNSEGRYCIPRNSPIVPHKKA